MYKNIAVTEEIIEILKREAEKKSFVFLRKKPNEIYLRKENTSEILYLNTNDEENVFETGLESYDFGRDISNYADYGSLLSDLEEHLNRKSLFVYYNSEDERMIRFFAKASNFNNSIQIGSIEDIDNTTEYVIKATVALDRYIKTMGI